MESAHSHHHLQDQLVGSSATSPSCYGLGNTTHANWPPSSFLNTNGFTSSHPSETTLSSRLQENDLLPSHYTSMSPDLTFNWANNSTENFTTNQCEQDLQYSRIKEELAELYYRKYTETTDSDEERRSLQQSDLRTRLLLKSFSSGNLMNKIQPGLYSDDIAASNGKGFCQIFPSINVSSSDSNQTGLTNARALDMNLEAVDLLASSRFGGSNFVPSEDNQTGILRDGFSFGFDHMQQSLQIPFYGSNKVSASSNVAVEAAKRNCNKMEPKAHFQNAPKKSRLEARSSCPPFKVRKEKLGDRIAALQQLVAPFGKTDTASVLMEAIGYIKFLQSQVETLSVPYMKPSRNRVVKGGPAEDENEERKRDLKSRGLCLVPLSCLSYITDGGGAAVWPPPHFGGAA